MKKFGVDVKIEEEYKKYLITHQIYKPTTFSIPSDFSNLALLLAANVLLGDGLTIEINLGDMPQGDEAIVDILEKLIEQYEREIERGNYFAGGANRTVATWNNTLRKRRMSNDPANIRKFAPKTIGRNIPGGPP